MGKLKYKQVYDGEWVRPNMDGYRMACCDCGLVHLLNFKITKTGKVKFQAFRDIAETEKRRLEKRHKKRKTIK